MVSKVPIGERRWLWSKGQGTPDDHASILVISAHGGQKGGTFTIPDGNVVMFYASEGHATIDPGLRQVAQNEVIVKESIDPNLICPDYALTKYQGKKHGSESETYAEVDKVVKGYYGSSAQPVDVLTIRSRWARVGTAKATLGNTLKMLYDAGYRYTEIRCSFCRSTSSLFDNRSFSPYNPTRGGTPERKDRAGKVTTTASW